MLHSRVPESTKTLANELDRQGVKVVSLGAELADEKSVCTMVDEALAKSGGLDLVYNNAAILTPFREERDTVPLLRGTGVLMNLLDPGWLRTDLGGPTAPNAVESVMPGALVPALVDSEVHGVLFRAQDFAGNPAG